MIFVDRKEAAPASLSSPAALKEAAATEAYYQSWKVGDPAFDGFNHYKAHDVQQALRKLFKRKCAYCEKQLEKGFFEVEHYRPKGKVADCNHCGYWWLALAWTNLLPTCPGCNKGLKQHIVTADMTVAEVEAMQALSPKELHGKATQFPVGAGRLAAKVDDHFAEQPHIIDPTRMDPEPELLWRHDAAFSVLEPERKAGVPSIVGEATIRCLALNRVDLVESRTQILNRLKTQKLQIFTDLERDADSAGDPLMASVYVSSALRRVDDMRLAGEPDQPFSAMARTFVTAVEAELRAWATDRGYV